MRKRVQQLEEAMQRYTDLLTAQEERIKSMEKVLSTTKGKKIHKSNSSESEEEEKRKQRGARRSKGPRLEDRIGQQNGVDWLFPDRLTADYAGGAIRKVAEDSKLWEALQKIFDRSKTEMRIIIEQKQRKMVSKTR